MSNSPMTVAEIEEIKALVGNHYTTWESDDKEAAATYLARLLSMLTPPPDAAVWEAVEEISQELALPPCWCEGSGSDELDGTGPCFFEVEEKYLRTLLRAVQAPRLNLELERVYAWAGCRQCIHDKTPECESCVVDGKTTKFSPVWNSEAFGKEG